MTNIVCITSPQDFVRNAYMKSSDRFKLTSEDIQEVLSYKNISEVFTYCDWYGSETEVKMTLTHVALREFGNLEFHIQCSQSIPKHYFPSPFQIMKGKGLLCPTTYRVI